MEKKKSIQLNQAFGAVLTLILVAVLVIIAIVIFVQLESSFAGTSAVTVTNETMTLNITGIATSAAVGNCSFADFSVTTLINRSIGIEGLGDNVTLAETTDYTVDSTLGTVTNVTGDWNRSLTTYSYTWGSDACTASDNMTSEFGSYTSLIGLVGTIIFLGLVIGILVTAFAFGGRREV